MTLNHVTHTTDKGKVMTAHVIKAYGEVEVQLHSFLSPTLHRVEWSTSRPGRFNIRKEHRQRLNRRPGGILRRSGNLGEEKNLLSLPVFERRIVQTVAQRYPETMRSTFTC